MFEILRQLKCLNKIDDLYMQLVVSEVLLPSIASPCEPSR